MVVPEEASTRYYPRVHFPSLWARFEVLVDKGRLRAPEEVKVEIARQDDDLAAWGKTQSGLFVPLDPDQMTEVSRIEADFETLVDTTRGRSTGDPWVIALAKLKSYVVVTQERKARKRPKIPDVCDHYGIEWITLVELIRRENWTF